MTSGTLFGELCDYYGSIEDLAAQLRGRAVVYCDGFLAARYPESLPPKKLLSFTARQLPGYGGSLETAASDLKITRPTNMARSSCAAASGAGRF